LGPGWKWEKVSERLRRVCQEAGIAHLAPISAFRAAVETEGPTHFQEDGHWNERGHALAGREIADFLGRHGWIAWQRAAR
jgi:hypothetical protein